MRTKYALVIAASILVPTPALAQQQTERPCAPFATVLKNLAKTYHEVPVARGIGDQHSLFVIFASPDGTTWTATMVLASEGHMTCIIAAGTSWQQSDHSASQKAL